MADFPSGSQASPTGRSVFREQEFRLEHSRGFRDADGDLYPYVDGDLSCKIWAAGGDPDADPADLTLILNKESDHQSDANIFVINGASSFGVGTFYGFNVDITALALGPFTIRWYPKVNGADVYGATGTTPKYLQEILPYPHQHTPFLHELTLTEAIRVQLADNIVEVELDDRHIKLGINRALALYNRHRPRVKYGSLLVQSATVKYELPEYGSGVVDCEFLHREKATTADYDSALFNSYVVYPSYEQYMIAQSHHQMMQKTSGNEPDWEFVVENGKGYLLINGGSGTSAAYIYHQPFQLDEISPAWHEWIFKVSLAHSKMILGEARSKFDGVPGANTEVRMNGDSLKSESQSEIDAAIDEIRMSQPDQPPMFG